MNVIFATFSLAHVNSQSNLLSLFPPGDIYLLYILLARHSTNNLIQTCQQSIQKISNNNQVFYSHIYFFHLSFFLTKVLIQWPEGNSIRLHIYQIGHSVMLSSIKLYSWGTGEAGRGQRLHMWHIGHVSSDPE